jgi:adenine-specific DNA-methyltransferase
MSRREQFELFEGVGAGAPKAIQSSSATDYVDGEYLKSQIITYIGNKRALLPFIGQALHHAKAQLRTDKISFIDLFSGTGIVARFAKRHARMLIVNDLKLYSRVTNERYLTNCSSVDLDELGHLLGRLKRYIEDHWQPGFVTELYAPASDDSIAPNDRVFYTRRNATYLDTARKAIDTLPSDHRKFFLAPLLSQASMHTNTAGVFKGSHKNSKGVGQFGGSARSGAGALFFGPRRSGARVARRRRLRNNAAVRRPPAATETTR